MIAVPVGEMFICQNLGPNLSEIEVRTFVSIKKVILNQLLASKVEIIKKKAFLNLYVMNKLNKLEAFTQPRSVFLFRSFF